MDTMEQNKVDKEKALNLLNNVKPCFETSNSKVFTQLHIAAQQKAAKVININSDDININHFIINTGISEDGRYIADGLGKDSVDVGKVKKFFNVGNNKYEIGIVMQFTDYKVPLTKDLKDKDDKEKVLKEIIAYNEAKGTLKKFRELITDGIREYCRWFWGDGYNISESDLEEFIPEYDGGKIQVSGGEIKTMDTERMVEYLMNRTVDISKQENQDKEIGKNFKPRLGYKIGYEIIYK